MNPFQRARNEAHATRAKLEPLHAHTPIAAKDLLQKVELVLNIAIEPVCWRRLNIDPPCRSNIDPGRVAAF